MAQLSIEDRGAVRLITITNPPRGYMNGETAAELDAALASAEANDDVRALVLTGGVPGVFIRHFDVGEIVAAGEALASGKIAPGGNRADVPTYSLIDRLVRTKLPVIAAINGTCMGGGCETALACAIRVATKGDYMIGLPETRLGIMPGLGGMQMLARAVGPARAEEMVIRGRVVGPDEALRIGLVHELADDAVERALVVADELAALPPHGVATVRRGARRMAAGETLTDGIEASEPDFLNTLTVNDDAMAACRRFLETGEDILR
ncbi:MAG: enoyl-CoA hydratase/isomerase family protein [Pacificimonas sp.]